jgi:hypothetical protein
MFFLWVVGVFLLVLPLGVLSDPLSYWTHRKGYPDPGWKFLVQLPLWFMVLGAMLAGLIYSLEMSRVTSYGMDLYRVTAEGCLGLFLLMFVPSAGGIGGSFLALRLLPQRKMRMAGSRSSRAIGWVVTGYATLIVAGIVAMIALLSQAAGLSELIELGLSAGAISGIMFYHGRRANTPTVEAAMWHDERPPLLYLRSFDQEASRFVHVSHEDADKYCEISSSGPDARSYYLTLEQFLAREVNERIGPFIALGNPTDYLPPEGAYRTYTADGEWQEYIAKLLNRSNAILMQMGHSDNLNWELTSIRERGFQKKLFVVTPPLPSVGKDSWVEFWQRLHDRIKGIQPPSWDGFASSLKRAGYQPPVKDPGPGVVVTFDENSQGITLISGAKTPTEYVDAICRGVGIFSEERAWMKIEPLFKDLKD